MVAMEVISLDDTADNSLYILDSTPIMEEVTNVPKRKRKKPNPAPSASSGYTVLGGNNPNRDLVTTPKRKRKKKKSSMETIVIDDDNDGSVIELSDDERVGIIGGLLSRSADSIQRRVKNFQRLRGNRAKRNELKNKITHGQPPHQHKNIPPEIPGPAPKKVEELPKDRKLRPVVIDGSNVAFGHSGNTVFSSRGIEICYEYFQKKGHKVKAFIPQFRRRSPSTSDTHILDKLEKLKVLVFTPSRKVNGKMIVSYDDRMMVDYAIQSGGVIVTRDNLNDIKDESDDFKKTIEERLLMYTWVDEEIILFPKDPLGKHGPTLDEFLSFPPEEKVEET